MKRSCLLLTALAVGTLGITAAHADTFNFSFGTTASKFSGSGTLTGSLISPGVYLITGVSGVTDTGNGVDRTIAGIDDPGTFERNDNQLFHTNGGLDFDISGLSYSLDNGANINIYTDIFGDAEILERAGGANIVTERVSYTVTPASTAVTPEPGSFVLLGTGLLGAVGAARRRLFA